MRDKCATCNDKGYVKCLAHMSGDGCEDMEHQCPDCQPEVVRENNER